MTQGTLRDSKYSTPSFSVLDRTRSTLTGGFYGNIELCMGTFTCGGHIVPYDVRVRGKTKKNTATLLRTAWTREMLLKIFRNIFGGKNTNICVRHRCCARGKTNQHLFGKHDHVGNVAAMHNVSSFSRQEDRWKRCFVFPFSECRRGGVNELLSPPSRASFARDFDVCRRRWVWMWLYIRKWSPSSQPFSNQRFSRNRPACVASVFARSQGAGEGGGEGWGGVLGGGEAGSGGGGGGGTQGKGREGGGKSSLANLTKKKIVRNGMFTLGRSCAQQPASPIDQSNAALKLTCPASLVRLRYFTTCE